MMKQFFLSVCLLIFVSGMFQGTFANSDDTSLDTSHCIGSTESEKCIKNAYIKSIIHQKIILRKEVTNGESYIKKLDSFFVSQTDNTQALLKVRQRVLNAMDQLGTSKKHQDVRQVLLYIMYRIDYILLDVEVQQSVVSVAVNNDGSDIDISFLYGTEEEFANHLNDLSLPQLQDTVDYIYQDELGYYTDYFTEYVAKESIVDLSDDEKIHTLSWAIYSKYLELHPEILEEITRDAQLSKVQSDMRSLTTLFEIATVKGEISQNEIIGTVINEYSDELGDMKIGYFNDILITNWGGPLEDWRYMGDNRYIVAYIETEDQFLYQLLGFSQAEGDKKIAVINGNLNQDDIPSLFIDTRSGKHLVDGDIFEDISIENISVEDIGVLLANNIVPTSLIENAPISSAIDITTNTLPEDFTITAIDDSRCSECNTQSYLDQFKQMPQFANITFETKDFADDGVAEMLQNENISTLPAFIFSSKQGVSSDISQFLQPLPSGNFHLLTEASFKPFAKRSERGLLVVEDDILASIQETAHIKGSPDAQITWLKYIDVNSFYAQKLERDETEKNILDRYPDLVNTTTSQFVLAGSLATQEAAEVLECIAQVYGSDAYNDVLSQALQSGDNSRATLLSNASELGVNQDQVESCILYGDIKELISSKMAVGTDVFGITGIPGNVLINNQTGEYSILSGAHPISAFEDAIEALR